MMSAIGDTIHVLPVINAIKRHSPGARITWVLERAGASLMRGHENVDEIIVHGKGLEALLALRKNMQGRKFDLLIDLQVAMKAGLATQVIPAKIKLGFDNARARDLNWLFTNRRIPPHDGQHVQDQYLEFLEYLGVPAEPLEWKLGPWSDEAAKASALLRSGERTLTGSTTTSSGVHLATPGASRYCALVLASSVAERNWIKERWRELSDALFRQHHLQPVLVGGKSELEKEIAAAITQNSQTPVISTLGCTLRELVGVLDTCSLVISPDTAPVHMAVALDVPVIALNGYTNPRRTGPYRKFNDLLVDAYSDPGEATGMQQTYHPGRMEKITVEHVLEKVRVWEQKYRR